MLLQGSSVRQSFSPMAKDAVAENSSCVRGFVLALCAELKEEVRMGIALRNQKIAFPVDFFRRRILKNETRKSIN
jgi:hypothetical protein